MSPKVLYLYDEQKLLCSFLLRSLTEYNRIIRIGKIEGLLISEKRLFDERKS